MGVVMVSNIGQPVIQSLSCLTYVNIPITYPVPYGLATERKINGLDKPHTTQMKFTLNVQNLNRSKCLKLNCLNVQKPNCLKKTEEKDPRRKVKTNHPPQKGSLSCNKAWVEKSLGKRWPHKHKPSLETPLASTTRCSGKQGKPTNRTGPNKITPKAAILPRNPYNNETKNL